MDYREVNESIQTIDSKYSRNSRPSIPVTLDDFQYIKSLGSGSYSEVFLVKKYNSDNFFAMKVLYKQFLLRVGMN